MRELQMLTIVKTLHKHFDYHNWMLPTPIMVRLSDRQWPYEIHGLSVSPKEELSIMDNQGEWHKLELTDAELAPKIEAIYKRVVHVFHSVPKKEEKEVSHV